MKTSNQVDRIKIKLRLAEHTDVFYEVFGASTHWYALEEPYPIYAVQEFEKRYDICLPDSFKIFLTQVGRSGAGPGYGTLELDSPRLFMADPKSGYLTNEPLFDANMTKEKWDKRYEAMDNDITDEEYDKEIEKAYAGILQIAYQGCSNFDGIILNGKNAGRVLMTYDEIEYCPAFYDQLTFLDWYEAWLDEVISGDGIRSNDYFHEDINENEIVDQFLANIDDSYWKFRKLGELRSRPSLELDSIFKLWRKYRSVAEMDQKECILNFLTQFDYKNVKEELSYYAKLHPFIFLRNLHLFCPERTIDWSKEINDIKRRNAENSDLLEYIDFVTKSDMKIGSSYEAWVVSVSDDF